MDFIAQFRAARRVSTPLICIRTFDPKSTVKSIVQPLNGKLERTPILIWDAVQGLSAQNKTPASVAAYKHVLAGKPHLDIEELAQLQTRNLHVVLSALAADPKANTIIFIANAHMQWQNQDPNVIQGIWNLRDNFKGNACTLVLLTTPGATLPPELTNDVLLLDEPLPTAKQLEETVASIFRDAGAPASLTPEISEKAVAALIGIPAFPAEQATAMSLNIIVDEKDKTKVTGATLDINQLWDRKRREINNSPGLTVYEGKERLADIGGCEGVKEFMSAFMRGKKAPSVILWYDEVEKAYAGHGTDSSGTKTEMLGSQLTWHQEKNIIGALYFGIPGVSKSLLAKALGNEFDIPTIGFDLAAMQAGHVGESNANLRTSQKTVEATAGGGQILAIATSNNLAALPVELLRRFDLATFFFDIPATRKERDEIWAIHRTRLGLTSKEPNPSDEGWTGSDIKNCCEKADMLKWTLAKAANYVVPITKSDGKRIQSIRAEANNRYLSAANGGVYTINEISEVRTNVTAPSFSDEGIARKFQN